MLPTSCVRELQTAWFPHITNAGLNRIVELLEKQSPLLVHGCFTKAASMGCLATHIAWHHPEASSWHDEAGIIWLTHVAGLNPATSLVLREWDARGASDWTLREDMLNVFRIELQRRRRQHEPEQTDASPVTVG